MKALSEQLKGRMFLSVNEIVQLLGLSKSTVYRLKDSGILPFYQFQGCIKFNVGDLEAYVESCRTNAFQNEYGSSKTR